jgi:hypothetical protein
LVLFIKYTSGAIDLMGDFMTFLGVFNDKIKKRILVSYFVATYHQIELKNKMQKSRAIPKKNVFLKKK